MSSSLVQLLMDKYNSMLDKYNYLMVELRDPRSDSYPLMGSVWPTTALCVIYVLVVTVLGPRYVKYREPFQITSLMMVYNLIQTLLSGWMFLECVEVYIYPGGYSWSCEPVDYSLSPRAIRILNATYIFYLSKFLDMFDSLFFLARKKFSHLSLLHIVHHASMPWLVWWGARYVPGGCSVFGPMLNTFVHTLMYFYYFLAAMGPGVKKFLWWKKYLTTLQMVQFIIGGFYYFRLIFIDCNYPVSFPVGGAVTAGVMYCLFQGFYTQTYNVKQDGNNNNDDSEQLETQDVLIKKKAKST